MLFPLGNIVATPASLEDIEHSDTNTRELLDRHCILDAGELYEDDQQLNRDAVENGTMILSCFKLNTGVKIYVITEADRSVTTILRRDEY
jgi:hypothetical protein